MLCNQTTCWCHISAAAATRVLVLECPFASSPYNVHRFTDQVHIPGRSCPRQHYPHRSHHQAVPTGNLLGTMHLNHPLLSVQPSHQQTLPSQHLYSIGRPIHTCSIMLQAHQQPCEFLRQIAVGCCHQRLPSLQQLHQILSLLSWTGPAPPTRGCTWIPPHSTAAGIIPVGLQSGCITSHHVWLTSLSMQASGAAARRLASTVPLPRSCADVTQVTRVPVASSAMQHCANLPNFSVEADVGDGGLEVQTRQRAPVCIQSLRRHQ